MLRCIFSYTAEVRFQDVVAVQERHLAIRFYPDLQRKDVTQELTNIYRTHLVLSILCKVVEGGDMQLELARLREFPKACAKAYEIRFCDRDSQAH